MVKEIREAPMKDPKKRIKVAPIETSLLYLVGVLLPIVLMVLVMLSSSLRAEWSSYSDQNPLSQGWAELSEGQ